MNNSDCRIEQPVSLPAHRRKPVPSLQEPKPVRRNNYIAWAVLAGGLMITAVVSIYMKSGADTLAKQNFVSRCNEIHEIISEKLDDHAHGLWSGAALFDISDAVNREKWLLFIDRQKFKKLHPGTQAIGFSPLVPYSELNRHIQTIRNNGFPEYKVRPDGDRKIYVPVIYLYPFSGVNLRALGFDTFSEPVRRAGMEQARDTGSATLSGKVILVQEAGKEIQAGTVMYVPVYRKDMSVDSVEQRRAAIYGWVYSAWRMNDLMQGMLGRYLAKEKNLKLKIFDGGQTSTQNLLYENSSAKDNNRFSQLLPLDFNGHRWTLSFSQAGEGAFISEYAKVWLSMTGGILITLLLFFLIRALLNTRNRAQQIAKELTIGLRESEERLDRLAVHSRTIVWEVDAKGLYTYISHVAEQVLGYRQEEITGRMHFYDLYPEAGREKFKESAFVILEQQKAFRDVINPRLTKDGQEMWVSSNGIPVFNADGTLRGYSGSDTDITERKRSEDALQNEKKRLQAVLNTAMDGFCTVDVHGRLLDVSETYCRMTGFSKEELLTMHIADMDVKESQEGAACHIQQIMARGDDRFESIHRRKDGSEFNVEVSVQYRPAENEFVAFIRDITERKNKEAELIKAKQKAEESDRLKTAFLNNLSHEIRTPFNCILGFLSILQDPALPLSEKSEYFDMISKSAERLMNTIDDTVEFSKIQTGQIEMIETETDISRLAGDLIERFKPHAQIKGLNFVLNNSMHGAIIKTDGDKLSTVLACLINNAIKFTGTGTVELSIHRTAANLEFSVKDTGIGIPEERQQVIWEIFMQGDVSNTRKFEGSGLGLAIAKAYVKILGGEIRLESQQGKGSTFHFTIPYQPAGPGGTDSSRKAADTMPVQKSLKILVAEDDDLNYNYLNTVLAKSDYVILHAWTGREAVEICRNNPDTGIILMDVKMPDMDGYAATEEIRKFNPFIPIIAVTAYAIEGDRNKCLNAGMDDYLPKPVKPQTLEDLLKKWLP